MVPPDREKEGTVLFPGTVLPDDLRFTRVGRYTRRHFFSPMDLLRPVVNQPLALLQANIRHRSQIAPYLEAFLDSAATGLILALSEGVQQNFGVCVEEATYFAARFIEEANRSGARRRGVTKQVAFLFDHAITYEAAKRALQAGVSGIMYDASEGGRQAISIEENILRSKRFVRLAEKYEASTELEVGVIPGMEGAVETEFTDPSAVATLVQAYPGAAVAVSVGNEHYRLSPKGRGLQLGLFRRIRNAVSKTPLVLHGGTGVSEKDLRAAIAHRLLDKLNVGTAFLHQTLRTVAEARGTPRLTREQLRDPRVYRKLLFYLDASPQTYLDEAQRAVYQTALAKFAFLTGAQ